MFMMTYWVPMTLRDTQIRSRQNLFSGSSLGPKKRFLFRHFRKMRAIAIRIAWSLAEISE